MPVPRLLQVGGLQIPGSRLSSPPGPTSPPPPASPGASEVVSFCTCETADCRVLQGWRPRCLGPRGRNRERVDCTLPYRSLPPPNLLTLGLSHGSQCTVRGRPLEFFPPRRRPLRFHSLTWVRPLPPPLPPCGCRVSCVVCRGHVSSSAVGGSTLSSLCFHTCPYVHLLSPRDYTQVM